MTTLTGIYLTPTNASIPVADGTNWNTIAISGDATLASTGTLTVGTGAITNTKLASMTRGSVKVGNSSNTASDLTVGSAGQVLLSNGTDAQFVTLAGAISSISSTGVVAISSSTTLTVSAKTANYTLVSSDSASVITNNGATSAVVFTLPTPSSGYLVRFIITAAHGITIQTPSGNIKTNNSTATVSGTSLTMAVPVIGSILQLIATDSSTWIIAESIGLWVLS